VHKPLEFDDNDLDLLKLDHLPWLLPRWDIVGKYSCAATSHVLTSGSADNMSAPIDEVLTRQCPCLRDFDSWSVCGRLADSTASDRNMTHTGVYPGLAPGRVKTYILLVWSCIACIVGAITMVHRWDLAEVEEDGVASLCTWDLCEIRCLCEIRDRSSWPPLLALIWGARSRDPIQVGYRCMRTLISLGLLGLRVSILFLGCSM
jgi:hypothetical protein